MKLDDGIRKEIRKAARELLWETLCGDTEARYQYCVGRISAHMAIQKLLYGSFMFDMEQKAKLCVHWILRLERLAKKLQPPDTPHVLH